MTKHNHPSLHIYKDVSEIYLKKGELISVNLENTIDKSRPHYFHIEAWLTPNGDPIVFVPKDVIVKSYDEWDEEYKKHFE